MRSMDKAEVAIVIQGDEKDILIQANFTYCFLCQVEVAELAIVVFCNGSKEIGEFVFGMQPHVTKVYGAPKEDEEYRYDACIYLQQYPEVVYWNDRIKKNYPKLSAILRKWREFIQDSPLRQYEIAHPDRGINHYLYAINNDRNCINALDVYELLGMKKCYEYNIDIASLTEEHILNQYGLKSGEYFTVSYDVDCKGSRLAREWPAQRYEMLIQHIKEKYPKVKVVQISSENAPILFGVDINVTNNVKIIELACLMKNAKMQVGCDNMLPHLRAVTNGGKSIVLFGPTPIEYYAIEGNVNIKSDTCEGWCECLVGDCDVQCVQADDLALCMQGILMEDVLRKCL